MGFSERQILVQQVLKRRGNVAENSKLDPLYKTRSLSQCRFNSDRTLFRPGYVPKWGAIHAVVCYTDQSFSRGGERRRDITEQYLQQRGREKTRHWGELSGGISETKVESDGTPKKTLESEKGD